MNGPSIFCIPRKIRLLLRKLEKILVSAHLLVFLQVLACSVIFKEVAFSKVLVHVSRLVFVSACARKDHFNTLYIGSVKIKELTSASKKLKYCSLTLFVGAK